MISDLIQAHKLSVIHASLEEPEVEQVWHVISPFVNKDTPRFSASNEDLKLAVWDVVRMIESKG